MWGSDGKELAEFLLKLDNAEVNSEVQKSGLVGVKFRGGWVEFGQWENLCQYNNLILKSKETSQSPQQKKEIIFKNEKKDK